MNEYVPSKFIISGSNGTPILCCLGVSLTSHCSFVSNLWGLGIYNAHNLHRRRTLPFINMTLQPSPRNYSTRAIQCRNWRQFVYDTRQ